MKNMLNLLAMVLLFSGCSSKQKPQPIAESEINYKQQDMEIIGKIVQEFSGDRKIAASDLMVKVGMYFLNTPYVGHTLETGNEEKLVINLRELDCTTFAENCLAITRMLKSKKPGFDSFAEELQFLRYRDGRRNGYPSRLHYFSDWIHNNHQKEIIADVSQEIAHTIVPNRVSFMSTHPDSYIQLKNNPSLLPEITNQEADITNRVAYYIPKTMLAEVEDKLMEGDIIGITTTIKGMDISHVGILVSKDNRIHLMHASSVLEKVVISEETLDEYLKNSKSATGIMVARPL